MSVMCCDVFFLLFGHMTMFRGSEGATSYIHKWMSVTARYTSIYVRPWSKTSVLME